MKLSSSSSLVFALAISHSSSSLAAPAGDPAHAQSSVSSPSNNFNSARRGSVSIARSEVEQSQDDYEEEHSFDRRDGLLPLPAAVCDLKVPVLGSVGGVLGLVGGLTAGLGIPLPPLCPPPQAGTASFDAQSIDDPSYSPASDPTLTDGTPYSDTPEPSSTNTSDTSSSSPNASAASSSAMPPPSTTPSRRGVPSSSDVTGAPGTAVHVGAGTAEGVAPAPAEPVVAIGAGKAGDAAGTVGNTGQTVVEVGTGKVKTGKDAAQHNAPSQAAPVVNVAAGAANNAPVSRRSHRARRDVSPSPAPAPAPPSASPPTGKLPAPAKTVANAGTGTANGAKDTANGAKDRAPGPAKSAAGAAEDHAPAPAKSAVGASSVNDTGAPSVNPADKLPSQAAPVKTVVGVGAGKAGDAAGTAGNTAHTVVGVGAGTAQGAAPAPAQPVIGAAKDHAPVSRSHRARRDVPAPSSVSPPTDNLPVNPPVSTTTVTSTSTVTETMASEPTSA